MVAGMKLGNCGPNLIDYANAFVTENSTRRAGRYVTL